MVALIGGLGLLTGAALALNDAFGKQDENLQKLTEKSKELSEESISLRDAQKQLNESSNDSMNSQLGKYEVIKSYASELIDLGKGNVEEANKLAGTGLGLLFICGVIIASIVLLFLNPLLYLFGVTPDVLPYAQDFSFITAFGIPFLVSTTGGTHLIRADRSPTYYMTCMLVGAIINTNLGQ